ncbi:hypothetical protein OH720_01505 [Pseudomonas sp. WJP1]|uniref:hypothetical protein n=1 Tax=Pseudomonas sp. WJP1 TaxID=2986947 RepID=UPI00234ACA5C|nr:hypothetical protein [Pseudomonas sp. WJP1]WCM51717.1 hypothetical protein OH720_01505 [Pseudomonas sp. WJP1]
MRYLKVTAQDRSGNGKADAVLLHFHDGPANLVREAFAVDMSADGRIEFGFAGDINSDGKQNFQDQLLLTAFAEVFLQLNWFNAGNNWERYLKIAAMDHHKDGSPNIVTLQFSEDDGTLCTPIRIQRATAYDRDNDGGLHSFTNVDVNRDGVSNKADNVLLRKVAEAFIAFRWFDA